MLEARRVAVTGANGFVGVRTIEHLILASGCEVHACVRSFSKLARLAELPQQRLSFHRCDVLDPGSVRAALAGCDTVIHCAYGSDGEDALRWRTTVDGTRNVVESAEVAGVRRFVNMSTAAIHATADLEQLDERTPLRTAEDKSYESAKSMAERLVSNARLSSASLRPTVIYGPWGKDWTAAPIARLAGGVRGLPGGTTPGICNAVYIDDVVQAVVRACGSEAVGAFVIAAAEPVTWAAFYDAFRAFAPLPPEAGGTAIDAWEQELYAERAVADISKARRLLGYEPRFSFRRGMALVDAWARWAGLTRSMEPGGWPSD